MPQFTKEGEHVGSTEKADNAYDNNRLKRKTFQEQLQESKEMKQLEYQRMLESKNSSYKLDEESARFYEKLRKEELEKEYLIKENEKIELEKYSKLKEKSMKEKKSDFSSSMGIDFPRYKPRPIIKKRQTPQDKILKVRKLTKYSAGVDQINNAIQNTNATSPIQEEKSIGKNTLPPPVLTGYESSSEDD